MPFLLSAPVLLALAAAAPADGREGLGSGPIQVWAIGPARGDCNAYAVTKRHTLALMGYPTSLLLLTAARTPSGRNHMVLVIPAQRGDLTLDNLSDEIRPFRTTGYTILKQQSAANPRFWLKPI